MRWVKTMLLVLLFVTTAVAIAYVVALASDAYPRIDYSTGNYIRVYRLGEKPKAWIVIENDTYIAEAVSRTGNVFFTLNEIEDPRSYNQIDSKADWDWTWIPDFVQLEDGNWTGNPYVLQTRDGEWWGFRDGIYPSEWQTKGSQKYILWLQDGNYYFVSVIHVDGTPEFYERLPPPTSTASILAATWIALGSFSLYSMKKRNTRTAQLTSRSKRS